MTEIDLLYAEGWKDYALVDSGDSERLERFGPYLFRRPDPQVLWKRSLPLSEWEKADAAFVRLREDKGEWRYHREMPHRWTVQYKNISLWVEPTPFKHLGLFPEQSAQWDWMTEILSHSNLPEKPSVLNLFGYTGGASVACAKAGAFVTHVDASRPALTWAKENQILSGLPEDSIRWILEDVLAFVRREVRRGKKYDAIIMDPPAFGHGANGETWKFHSHFPLLLSECSKLFSETPLFIVVNAYAVSVSSLLLKTLLDQELHSLGGTISCGELVIKQESNSGLLSTGIYGRWSLR